MRIGAIEAGGTKMVCAVVDEMGNVLERASMPTRLPDETIRDIIQYFQYKKIEALGIACFGPVDLNPKSATYGYIMNTPKAGWAGTNIVGAFKEAFGVPVGFDTDVNGAVLGEVKLGAAKNCDNAIYITVGTGVGVGVYCNGRLVHGLTHPEAGHILLNRHPDDTYSGKCPFHSHCMEGLASGPAIEGRWGRPAIMLSEFEEVWNLEAYYIAQAVTNYILSYSPEKIVLWGGVLHQAELIEKVRKEVVKMLGGYISHPTIETAIDDYIVPPALGDNAGIVGAAMLGLERLNG